MKEAEDAVQIRVEQQSDTERSEPQTGTEKGLSITSQVTMKR
jgi:hypothetical protein